MITVGVLTLSDRGFQGIQLDISGEEIKRLVQEIPGEVSAYEILPDDRELITSKLIELADVKGVDLILTTGGTGVAPRDVTPEATLAVLEKQMPGIPEIMRIDQLARVPRAMNFRGVAGIRGKTLIINLPGRPRAVRENLSAILPELAHTICKIRGDF